MTDPFDDRLRSALHDEVHAVHANDELLERVRSATSDAPPARRHGALLALAAVVAIAVGLAAIVLNGEDAPHQVDAVDDPSTTTTRSGDEDLLAALPDLCAQEERVDVAVSMAADASDEVLRQMGQRLADDPRVASLRYVDRDAALAARRARGGGEDLTANELPTAFLITLRSPEDDLPLRGEVADLPGVIGVLGVSCDGASATGQPPVVAVAVTEHGHLVVIDTRTGSVTRDLGGFDDPTDPAATSREGGALTITGVALHPNGREVYFETCCEPASGAVYRIPIDGSVPIDARLFDEAAGHRVAYGYGVDISADGRWLAYVSGPVVSVMDLETGEVPHTFESGDGTHDWVQATLNADGSVIAIERALDRGPDGEVLRSDVRTTSLRDGTYEEHPTAGGRFMPLWLGSAGLSSAPGPGEVLRDANVDPSGRWILVVTGDGRLVARGEPTPSPIPGQGYVAADW